MADNTIQLKIIIDGRDANASIQLTNQNVQELYKAFRYGQQEVNGLETGILRAFQNARDLFQGVRASFDAFRQSFGDLLKEYGGAELGQQRLATALKQSGQYSDEAFESLKQYAEQLQATTLYDNDTYVSVMAMLQAMGLNTEQTKAATIQVANLATLMGTDLTAAARVMGDVFNGNTGMIGRYIKGLDTAAIQSGDLNKILDELNKHIGGQATAAAETGAGAMMQMSNAIADMKKNGGKLISEVITPLIVVIKDFIFSLNQTSPAISGAIVGIAALVTGFIALRVTGIGAAAKAIFTELIPALRALTVAMMTNPYLLALAAIVAVGVGLYALLHNQKAANDELSRTAGLAEAAADGLDKLAARMQAMTRVELLQTESLIAMRLLSLKDHLQDLYKQMHDNPNPMITINIENAKGRIKVLEDSLGQFDAEMEKRNKAAAQPKTFDEQKAELDEAQRHGVAMLQAENAGDKAIIQMKIANYDAMLSLFKKFGQDTVKLEHERLEAITALNTKYPGYAGTSISSVPPKGMTTQPGPNLKEPPALQTTDDMALNAQAKKVADIQTKLNDAVLESDRLRLRQQLKLEQQKLDFMEMSAEEQKQLEKEKAQAAISAAQDSLSFIAGALNQNTAAYKAIAIAQATWNTYQSATNAMLHIPWPFNLVAAALDVAAGLAYVGKIAGVGAPKMATGGEVQGEDGIDRVPAWLTAGEFVMTKEAASRNRSLLESMNRGLVVPRYAGGGIVVAGPSNSSSGFTDLKKEFAALRKAISKMKNEVNIQSNFDIQNYTKANKKMQRVQAAKSL
jgi:hypothetical protein